MNWSNVIVCAVCFAVGFGYAAYRGDAELAQAQLDAAIERANMGKDYYAKLVKAQNELEAARGDSINLRGELERVRKSYADRARKADSAGSVACPANARCEELLRESIELLVEGGDLLQRNAAQHDALANAVK